MNTIIAKKLHVVILNYSGRYGEQDSMVPMGRLLTEHKRLINIRYTNDITKTCCDMIHSVELEDLDYLTMFLYLILEETDNNLNDLVDPVMLGRMFRLFMKSNVPISRMLSHFLSADGSQRHMSCHICARNITQLITEDLEYFYSVPDVSDFTAPVYDFPVKFAMFDYARCGDTLSMYSLITMWVKNRPHVRPSEYYQHYLDFNDKRVSEGRTIFYHPFQQNGHFHFHSIKNNDITCRDYVYKLHDYLTVAHGLNFMSKTLRFMWNSGANTAINIKGPFSFFYFPIKWTEFHDHCKLIFLFALFVYTYGVIPHTFFECVPISFYTQGELFLNNEILYDRLVKNPIDVTKIDEFIKKYKLIDDKGVMTKLPMTEYMFNHMKDNGVLTTHEHKMFKFIEYSSADELIPLLPDKTRLALPFKLHYDVVSAYGNVEVAVKLISRKFC